MSSSSQPFDFSVCVQTDKETSLKRERKKTLCTTRRQVSLQPLGRVIFAAAVSLSLTHTDDSLLVSDDRQPVVRQLPAPSIFFKVTSRDYSIARREKSQTLAGRF